jgi:hypothetical protein
MEFGENSVRSLIVFFLSIVVLILNQGERGIRELQHVEVEVRCVQNFNPNT